MNSFRNSTLIIALVFALTVVIIKIYVGETGRVDFLSKIKPVTLLGPKWEETQSKNVSKLANHSSDEETQRPTNTLKGNEPRQKAGKEKESTGNCRLFVSTGLRGRLGNQMFEYAATVGVAHSQGRIPALLTMSSDLQDTFQVTHARTFNTSDSCDSWQVVSGVHFGIFEIRLTKLPTKNITMSGFRQSWKYFASAQNELKKEFTFKERISADAKNLEEEIRRKFPNRTLVGVHARRGDFLTSRKLGYNSPAPSYYYKAFDRMIKEIGPKTSSLLFVVSSDDLKWCAANIKRPDVHVLSPASAQLHLAFLARTSHAVISAGTFSWWAGWLTGGKVIYFSGYPRNGTFLMNDFKAEDYYPPHWIGIGD
ncbi:galactoside 2-alpha-L-fucosyltransferase 3 [Aplysia californica]|uniref:L-Fucosyltransferase n=1 Tax=Aplysia californica TaxID=6500 RepID=A0ABM0JJD8_APLCA|nr:galactoside 2-alpha-L-fucosyltransferase 3 [Aplysia californica]